VINAIESLNLSLRKVTKARGSFPNDEAVSKLLYLAVRNIAKKWTIPVYARKDPSTASPSFTKTDCRLPNTRLFTKNAQEEKPGYGNRGKQTPAFPAFPQPLLVLITGSKSSQAANKNNR